MGRSLCHVNTGLSDEYLNRKKRTSMRPLTFPNSILIIFVPILSASMFFSIFYFPGINSFASLLFPQLSNHPFFSHWCYCIFSIYVPVTKLPNSSHPSPILSITVRPASFIPLLTAPACSPHYLFLITPPSRLTCKVYRIVYV